MRFPTRFLTILVCALFAFGAAPVKAQDISRLLTLDSLLESEPEAALAEVDAALNDPVVVGRPPDLRILMDLLALRADLLERLGQPLDAARAWAQLGRTQAFARNDLGVDPAPSFQKAADLFEAHGAPGPARQAIEAAIAAERETGEEDGKLLQLYRTLARLAEADGAPEIAETARAAVDAIENPAFESAPLEGEGGFASVEVYYATDRARSGLSDPVDFYTGQRGNTLELGVATVTIPDSHEAGQVERPSVWRLEFRSSPSRHVQLKSVRPLDDAVFFSQLKGEFRDGNDRDLFVYIHGFNHSFEYAAQRAAQLAFDMGNSAVPVLFSWPSRNTTVGYIADAAVVRLSGRRLAVFLEDLIAESGAQTIHVIAHSMGNRALTDALEIMALNRAAKPGDDPVFGQVMFAAPDVDAQLFAAMARVFQPLAKRMTLYASSKDWALVSSRKLHGSAPRAGLGGDVLLAADGFDSVDMSDLGEDMLAHNYFSNDSSALADMMTLFWHDAPPDQRCGLEKRATRGLPVWEYRKGRCPSNDLIGVIANLRHERVRDSVQMRALVPTLLPQQDRMNSLMPVLERILLGG